MTRREEAARTLLEANTLVVTQDWPRTPRRGTPYGDVFAATLAWQRGDYGEVQEIAGAVIRALTPREEEG